MLASIHIIQRRNSGLPIRMSRFDDRDAVPSLTSEAVCDKRGWGGDHMSCRVTGHLVGQAEIHTHAVMRSPSNPRRIHASPCVRGPRSSNETADMCAAVPPKGRRIVKTVLGFWERLPPSPPLLRDVTISFCKPPAPHFLSWGFSLRSLSLFR